MSKAMNCISCKLALEPGATKCPHCGSAQTRRRHLAFSSLVLSLLVALASVTGLVAPVIHDTFHTPRSVVNVTVTDVGPIKPLGGSSINDLWTGYQFHLSTRLVVTNSGERAGVLVGDVLELSTDTGSVATGRFALSGERSKIQPGQTRVEEVLVPLTVTQNAGLPTQIMDGPNGGVLDASEPDAPIPLAPMTAVVTKVTLHTIQSSGDEAKIETSLGPDDLRFNVL